MLFLDYFPSCSVGKKTYDFHSHTKTVYWWSEKLQTTCYGLRGERKRPESYVGAPFLLFLGLWLWAGHSLSLLIVLLCLGKKWYHHLHHSAAVRTHVMVLWSCYKLVIRETDVRSSTSQLKGTGLEVTQTWAQTPALPLPRCVILRRLFTTLSFRFPWMQSPCKWKWGLAAKVNKETSQRKRKLVLFQGLQPGLGGGEGRLVSKGRLPPPSLTTSGQELLSMEGGGYMQKLYSQLCHLETDLWWSD